MQRARGSRSHGCRVWALLGGRQRAPSGRRFCFVVLLHRGRRCGTQRMRFTRSGAQASRRAADGVVLVAQAEPGVGHFVLELTRAAKARRVI